MIKALRRLDPRKIGVIEIGESKPIVNPFHQALSGNPIIIRQRWTRRILGGWREGPDGKEQFYPLWKYLFG